MPKVVKTSEELSRDLRRLSCRPKSAAHRWPAATTPRGAVLYAAAAGLIVWLLSSELFPLFVTVLSDVHVYISWH